MTQQTTAMPSANDLLNGGRSTGLKMGKTHVPQGTMVGGRIVNDPSTYHVREYDASNPGQGPLKYFPSGDPIYGLSVDIQTDQRDPSIEDDDGVRRMFIEKKRQLNAVRDAVRQSGAAGLAIGGALYLAWTGEEAGKGGQPATLWAAQYTPPTVSVPGTPAPPAPAYAAPQPPQPQQPAATYAPATAAAPTAPPAQPPAEAAAAFANLNPDQIKQLLAMSQQPQT